MKLNIQAAFEDTPPELDFVWPGLLAGTVGALIAPGGVIQAQEPIIKIN